MTVSVLFGVISFLVALANATTIFTSTGADSYQSSEYLQLSGSPNTCRDPPDYPLLTTGSISFQHDLSGDLVVCGGFYNNTYYNTCFGFKPIANGWFVYPPMLHVRYNAAFVKTSFGLWAISMSNAIIK